MAEIALMPLARYRLEWCIDTPLQLPDYAGSALRGAMGHALRAAACVTKMPDCGGCAMVSTCPYAVIFESRPPQDGHALQKFSHVPHPYVIEPPPWGQRTYAPGESLSFHLVLAGRALAHLPLLLWAIGRAFAKGIGAGDGRATLKRVVHVGTSDTLVLAGPKAALQPHNMAQPPLPAAWSEAGKSVQLRFDTPLRLQKNGRPLRADELSARDLLMHLVRRVALIHEFHGPEPMALDFSALAQQASLVEGHKQLRWLDWSRYSSRQQQKMSLGGVVGRWTLHGDLRAFLPFLHLGQWLHVGKETTFGLGGYQVEHLT